MILSRTKFRTQVRGAASVCLIPDLLERTSHIIRTGYSFPRWWKVYKMTPPKTVMNGGPLKEIKMPFDHLVKKAVTRMPMLRKEHLDFNDKDFSPIAVRFAQTQYALMKEKNLSEEQAFVECEEKIFKEELWNFAKAIRRSPGSYFKLTDKEAQYFKLHDMVNAQVYADGASKAAGRPGTTDAAGVDYRTALNALYNSPVASPVRALALPNPRPYLESLLEAYRAAAAAPEAPASAEVMAHYRSAAAVAAAADRLAAALAAGDISASTLAQVEGEKDAYGRVLATAADGTMYRRIPYTSQLSGPPRARHEVVTEVAEGVDRDALAARYPPLKYTERQRYVAGRTNVPLNLLIDVVKAAEAVAAPEMPSFSGEASGWHPELLRERVSPDSLGPRKARNMAAGELDEQALADDVIFAKYAKLPRPAGQEDEGELLYRSYMLEQQLLQAVNMVGDLEALAAQHTKQLRLAGVWAEESQDSELASQLELATSEAYETIAECEELLDQFEHPDSDPEEEVPAMSALDARTAAAADAAAPSVTRAISMREHVWHSEILRMQQKLERRRVATEKLAAAMKREEEMAAQIAEAQRKAAAEAAALQAQIQAAAPKTA